MNRALAALAFAAATLAAPTAWAQGNPADVTDMQALRTAVRADKKAYVASVLSLTDAEAKKFWPLYDASDEIELRARRTLQNKLMRALPPKKAVRYLQLEAKIRAFQAYDIATGIALVK
jgi:hypothetical protein